MKGQIMTGIMLIASTLSYGQTERKKKVNHSEFFSRKYYCLKEDPSVKDGPYELSVQGTSVILGQYEKSRRTGIWTFSNSAGEELYRYDYSSDSLISWNKGKFDAIKWEYSTAKEFLQNFYSVSLAPYIDFYSHEFTVYKGTDTIRTTLDRPPLLLGSYMYFQVELFDIVRAIVPDLHVNSRSLIRFVVDAHGNTKDFKVIAGSGLHFEEALISQLKQKPLKWVPGKLGDDYVDTEITLPIIIHTDYTDQIYFRAGNRGVRYTRSNIVFTDLAFISHFSRLKRDKDFKYIDSWRYVIFN